MCHRNYPWVPDSVLIGSESTSTCMHDHRSHMQRRPFPFTCAVFFAETTNTKINLVTTDFVQGSKHMLLYIEKATAYMLPGKLLHHLQSLFVSQHICVSFLYRTEECSLLASPLWVEVPTSKSKSSET